MASAHHGVALGNAIVAYHAPVRPPRKPITELLGDLAVHVEELDGTPRPRDQGTTLERFERWFAFGSRLFHLAIEAGIARQTEPLPADELAVLLAGLDRTKLLDDLRAGAEIGFRNIANEFHSEYGYFYAGEPWRTFCVTRSGLEYLGELVGDHPRLVAQLDLTEIERLMAHWGEVLFTAQDVLPGMPASHWWWFGGRAR